MDEILDMKYSVLPASFRDPSGFICNYNGRLYRQVNIVYREHYDHLMNSGLYDALVEKRLLIPHREVDPPFAVLPTAYKFLCPEPIDFISYPYEWSFSQLKYAALLTLEVQRLALNYGMSLKDASAYNVQFRNGSPLLIDTLSFEKYQEGRPWFAYRQFCQHFLAPLSLMCKKDIRLNQLLRPYIDGIPLDLTSALLPFGTWLKYGLIVHIHLHAKSQRAFSNTNESKEIKAKRFQKVSKLGFIGLIESLDRCIKRLEWKPIGTEWADYYNATNYSETAFKYKHKLVRQFLKQVHPTSVWDLGANIGEFSRIASTMEIPTVAFDIDPAAVEMNYKKIINDGEKNLLPLLLDLTNPSPNLGWAGAERDSLRKRGPVDCMTALALIHHIAISNNVPLERISSYFAQLCKYLIIEFVPKKDSQVHRLLSSRIDIFDEYDQVNFENKFRLHFDILQAKPVQGSERVLYLMKNNGINSD